MTIDLTTGLPSLKEGQFWRVCDANPDWYDPTSYRYAVVQLMERVETTFVEKRTIMFVPFGTRTYKETEEKVVARQAIWDPDRRIKDNNYSGTIILVDGVDYYPVPVEMITPSLVLEAAKEALKWYETKKNAEKLLGDYPPNTLPAVENA